MLNITFIDEKLTKLIARKVITVLCHDFSTSKILS